MTTSEHKKAKAIALAFLCGGGKLLPFAKWEIERGFY